MSDKMLANVPVRKLIWSDVQSIRTTQCIVRWKKKLLRHVARMKIPTFITFRSPLVTGCVRKQSLLSLIWLHFKGFKPHDPPAHLCVSLISTESNLLSERDCCQGINGTPRRKLIKYCKTLSVSDQICILPGHKNQADNCRVRKRVFICSLVKLKGFVSYVVF